MGFSHKATQPEKKEGFPALPDCKQRGANVRGRLCYSLRAIAAQIILLMSRRCSDSTTVIESGYG